MDSQRSWRRDQRKERKDSNEDEISMAHSFSSPFVVFAGRFSVLQTYSFFSYCNSSITLPTSAVSLFVHGWLCRYVCFRAEPVDCLHFTDMRAWSVMRHCRLCRNVSTNNDDGTQLSVRRQLTTETCTAACCAVHEAEACFPGNKRDKGLLNAVCILKAEAEVWDERHAALDDKSRWSHS